MSAKDAAHLLKLWAADRGLVHKENFATSADEDIVAADFGQIGAVTPAAVDALHARGISYIAFNDADSKVIVFTHRRFTKKERALLPETIGDNVTIEYRQGVQGAAGGPPQTPVGVPPYTLRGNRYTCGSSIHPANIVDAGTLGCLVRDANGMLYGLSNNHVTGGCNFSQPDMPILAPGPVDAAPGGVDPFTIGYHARLLAMMDGLPQNINVAQNSDAAIFRIKDANLVSSMQRDVCDTPAQVLPIAPNMQVQKVGRTTGLTNGLVRGQVSGPEFITYKVAATGGAAKIVFFDSLFIVEGAGQVFATGGDSGSLITALTPNGERAAVGIVVGMNAQSGVCFALPIAPILGAFGVTLVDGHNP